MSIEKNNIIYELIDDPNNQNQKCVTIIKCLSNKSKITIPDKVGFPTSNGNNSTTEYKVKSISSCAFKDCENLKRVKFDKKENIKIIGESAFENCISMTSFTIPPCIKEISSKCFYKCISLKKLKYFDQAKPNLDAIQESAFENCYKLHSIEGLNIEKVENIGKYAFKNCFNLSTSSSFSNLSIFKKIEKKIRGFINPCVKIHSDHIRQIEEAAFENCKNVNITGKLLKYGTGEKYESINSAMKKHWTPSIIFYSLFFVTIMLILILSSFKNSNFGIIASLFLLFIEISFFCFNNHKYTKTDSDLLFGFISLTLSFFLLALVLCFFSRNNQYLYKNISLINNNTDYYINDANTIDNEAKIDVINADTFAYDSSIPYQQVEFKNHIFIINYNNQNSIKMVDYFDPTLFIESNIPTALNSIDLNFLDDTNNISLKINCDLPILYSTNEDDTTYKEFELYSENTYISELNDCEQVSIFTFDNDDKQIKIFDLYFINVKSQLAGTGLTTAIGITIFACFIFLVLTIVVLIQMICKGQSTTERFKFITTTITVVSFVIISFIKKDNILETLKGVITSILGI
jgi:hypothetical protein